MGADAEGWFMDAVKEEMKETGKTVEDTEDMKNRGRTSAVGTQKREKPKDETRKKEDAKSCP